MIWKKKRPIGVLVSMESVRLRKLTPRSRSSSISHLTDSLNLNNTVQTTSTGVTHEKH